MGAAPEGCLVGAVALGEGPARQEWPGNRHQRLCPLVPMAERVQNVVGTSGRSLRHPPPAPSEQGGEGAALQRPWLGVRVLDPNCTDNFITQTLGAD